MLLIGVVVYQGLVLIPFHNTRSVYAHGQPCDFHVRVLQMHTLRVRFRVSVRSLGLSHGMCSYYTFYVHSQPLYISSIILNTRYHSSRVCASAWCVTLGVYTRRREGMRGGAQHPGVGKFLPVDGKIVPTDIIFASKQFLPPKIILSLLRLSRLKIYLLKLVLHVVMTYLTLLGVLLVTNPMLWRFTN